MYTTILSPSFEQGTLRQKSIILTITFHIWCDRIYRTSEGLKGLAEQYASRPAGQYKNAMEFKVLQITEAPWFVCNITYEDVKLKSAPILVPKANKLSATTLIVDVIQSDPNLAPKAPQIICKKSYSRWNSECSKFGTEAPHFVCNILVQAAIVRVGLGRPKNMDRFFFLVSQKSLGLKRSAPK